MAPSLSGVLLLRPYFKEVVWGGQRLQELYGKSLPAGRPIGESFEVSAGEGQESVVATGPLAGWSLGRLIAEYQEELVGQKVWESSGGEFPLLIKLLDARENLSIQVHPDDRYVREKGLGARGKAEAWYVLSSQGGRVVQGLKEGVGRQDLVAAIDAGRVEEVVQSFEVEPGDVVALPPGTVHALGRGVVLYEVQQSCDLTYRLYDYGRVDQEGNPRELHLAEALEVTRFDVRPPAPLAWRKLPGAQADRAVLAETEAFQLNLYSPSAGQIRHGAGNSCLALTLVRGEARISAAPEVVCLGAGSTALIPAYREFVVEQQGEVELEYLIASAAVG